MLSRPLSGCAYRVLPGNHAKPPIFNLSTICQAAVSTTATPPGPAVWRASSVLDEWVQREARPVSLRQLTVFGRELTARQLLRSAEYCRRELPTRLAHRLRDMQTLPYAALINPHIGSVYELYYRAFELFRKQKELHTLEDNDRYCALLRRTLTEHLAVIPQMAMGILEVSNAIDANEADRFMETMLRSRISRRVIAEQHLALTDSFHAPHSSGSIRHDDEFVGQILLKCNARDVVERCVGTVTSLAAKAYGPDIELPRFVLQGDLNTVFPYIPSHIEYIVGELLRNSVQATVERSPSSSGQPPPIDILICQAAQQVVIRVSDQGGGVDRELLPYLWSFSKGPRRKIRLENLGQVPQLAATMQEVQLPDQDSRGAVMSPEVGQDFDTLESSLAHQPRRRHASSLSPLATRSPNLKLGIGLPMSKIYAEYWAGSLELHSLDGYGCDAFLQISRLGNKNETVSTRASMDAV